MHSQLQSVRDSILAVQQNVKALESDVSQLLLASRDDKVVELRTQELVEQKVREERAKAERNRVLKARNKDAREEFVRAQLKERVRDVHERYDAIRQLVRQQPRVVQYVFAGSGAVRQLAFVGKNQLALSASGLLGAWPVGGGEAQGLRDFCLAVEDDDAAVTSCCQCGPDEWFVGLASGLGQLLSVQGGGSQQPLQVRCVAERQLATAAVTMCRYSAKAGRLVTWCPTDASLSCWSLPTLEQVWSCPAGRATEIDDKSLHDLSNGLAFKIPEIKTRKMDRAVTAMAVAAAGQLLVVGTKAAALAVVPISYPENPDHAGRLFWLGQLDALSELPVMAPSPLRPEPPPPEPYVVFENAPPVPPPRAADAVREVARDLPAVMVTCSVESIVHLPPGRILVGCGDGSIRIVSLASGKTVHRFMLPEMYGVAVRDLVLFLGGAGLFSLHADTRLNVWAMEEGALIAEQKCPFGEQPHELVFDEGLGLLAAAGEDEWVVFDVKEISSWLKSFQRVK